MKSKNFLKTLVVLLGIAGLTSCSKGGLSSSTPIDTSTNSSSVVSTPNPSSSVTSVPQSSVSSSKAPSTVVHKEPFIIKTEDESNVSVITDQDETVVTINAPGIYNVTGDLFGRIEVLPTTAKSVTLVMNGVTIRSSTSCINYLSESSKVVLEALEKTTNTLISKESAVISNNNIEIKGAGGIYVDSGKHAFDGSNITVSENPLVVITAKKDGLHAKKVEITGGDIDIYDSDDGVQVDKNSSLAKGTFDMSGGVLKVRNSKSAVKAETSINVSGGSIVVENCKNSLISGTEEEIEITIGEEATITVDGEPFVLPSKE